MLVFKYNKNGVLKVNDWEVCLNDKKQVDELFRDQTVAKENENQDL
jgi:hypothetical protein